MQHNLNFKERNLVPFYFRKTKSQSHPTAEIQTSSQYLSSKVSRQCSTNNGKHDSYHRYLSKKKGCVFETNTPIFLTATTTTNLEEQIVWEESEIVYALSLNERYFRPAIITEILSNNNYHIQFYDESETHLRTHYQIESYFECNEVVMRNGKIYVPIGFQCNDIVYNRNPETEEQRIINQLFI